MSTRRYVPAALVVAIAASIGIHLAALFGPDIDLSTGPESLPLKAELRPMPAPPLAQPQVEPEKKVEKPKPVKDKTPRRKARAVSSATPVLSVPDTSPVGDDRPAVESTPAPVIEAKPDPIVLPPEPELAPVEPRLPPHGIIRYRVDRGDSNFEIGIAKHEWEIADGRYRLSSVVETTGLVWLFKPYRIEMESSGLIDAEGLRPETFALRRNGKEAKERASFDWENMTVRVGNRAEQALTYGSQDLLSFGYQLGFIPHLEAGVTLSIATGKKYGVYYLEVLGDEEIQVPAGIMRTLHVRAPGTSTTELWLAYDHLLLPVKIRQVDAEGDSFVQVATQIQLSPP